MKKILLTVLVVAAMAGMIAVAYAQLKVFVLNQPFKAEILEQKGVLYAPLEKLLPALKTDWKQTGNTVELTKVAKPGDCQPIKGSDLTFVYNGKNFTALTFVKKGVLYAGMKSFIEGMGGVYSYDPDYGIADIALPMSAKQIQTLKENQPFAIIPASTPSPSPSETSSPDATPAPSPTATGGKEEKEPIVATEQHYQNYNPQNQGMGGEMRGQVRIENTGDVDVKNVRILLHFYDGDGKDIRDPIIWDFSIMKPGQVEMKDFYWLNPNPLMIITPKTEVKHDKIEKKKKDETKK
ncbi:MAG: hypothetical protein M1536_08855 [Firmicutes bacterium]|nr:hypothetical protein [Bacillota bacterium]